MTIDAVRAGLDDRRGRARARAPRDRPRPRAASSTAAASSRDIVLALRPAGRNHRGLRLPLVGWVVGARAARAVAAGRRDRARRRPLERRRSAASARTSRARRDDRRAQARRDPARRRCCATRSLSGALLVGLAANLLNQLDTRPGRALKAYLAGVALRSGAPRRRCAVLLAPYDLREMAMLGDAGSNALGRRARFESVEQVHGRGALDARSAALAGLTLLGERRSLGDADRADARCFASSTRSGRQP